MAPLLTPPAEPLTLAGTKRTLRRPDLRGLLVPRLSAAPLSSGEIDYDDLIIQRAYRSFDPSKSGEVKYMMYELSQKNPGEDHYTHFWKAVRIARVTRVPRYLRRSTSSGPNMVFEQQRDILAALREQQVLFLNIIAKSAQTPMIFAYGVQGVGDTIEEAQRQADEGWAVLTFQLAGQFQQLEYQQLSVFEAETLVRHQAEWNHIAMARGRPVPAGGNFGMANLLDGNRTEVESTLNQLESFLRGMSDQEFMLSLVTVPIGPAQMMSAWRNISTRLSQIRSEQQGTRSLSVGMALPLSMGQSLGDTSGSGHAVGASVGVGSTTGISHALASGQSLAVTNGVTHGVSTGHSASISDANTHGVSVGTSDGVGQSTTHNVGVSNTQGNSLTDTKSMSSSASESVGSSLSATAGKSSGLSSSGTASTGQSLSEGANWGSSFGTTLSQQSGSSVHGGLPGVAGGGTTNSSGQGQSAGQSAGNSLGTSLSGSVSKTNGISLGESSSLSQGANWGQSLGVSNGQSLASSSSVSSSASEGLANGLSVNHGISQGSSAAVSTGASQGVSDSTSAAASNSQSQGQSVTDSSGSSQATSANQGYADTSSSSFSRSVQQTAALGVVPSVGMSFSRNVYDESKRILGDIIETQQQRYMEGVEGGAFLYQMFLVCPDRATLVGAAGLLKSSFWGLGTRDSRVAQPFHTINDFDDDERGRLLLHGRAFTSYRRREPSMALIEPYWYSSFLTTMEAAAFCHPPTSESSGLMGVVDSMPVLSMPAHRQHRDITLGRLINGERARVDNMNYGVDVDEITHTLLAGTTGIGKTTTLMTMLTDISRVERTIVERASVSAPTPVARTVKASILGLDWMSNMRDLASVVEPERFRFYSIAKPHLGEFRWNPLAVPDDDMNPVEWAGDMADNMTISFNLGEFGRSIIAELLSDLYSANRLEPFALRPELRDEKTNVVLRDGIYLPVVDRGTLPVGAIQTNADGSEFANVLTCPALSRLISVSDLATMVLAKVEEAATVEGARLHGPAFRDRIQSLWRRVMYFAPGSMWESVFSCDERLDERTTLSVSDLIDPDQGLVTVIETDGMDLTNRRFILGSVLLAVWRYGQFKGEGCFNHNNRGPGTFVCLEEAHELFGSQGDGEDSFSAATRTSLYESMFRRARALGMKLLAVVQNCGDIPEAVTSNTTTVMFHRQYAEADRKRAFSLLNWSNMVNQQIREWRYLGEMAQGYLIVRLDAKQSYLESAPVQVLVEPAALSRITDKDLVVLKEATQR